MNEGLLDLRRAQVFAATLDEQWGEKSHATFLRWIKLQAEDDPALVRRLTPGLHAPIYVRKSVLRRMLDAEDRGVYSRLDAIESEIQSLRADLRQVRRSVGLPENAS